MRRIASVAPECPECGGRHYPGVDASGPVGCATTYSAGETVRFAGDEILSVPNSNKRLAMFSRDQILDTVRSLTPPDAGDEWKLDAVVAYALDDGRFEFIPGGELERAVTLPVCHRMHRWSEDAIFANMLGQPVAPFSTDDERLDYGRAIIDEFVLKQAAARGELD
jgi:hypothetical protein